MDERDERAAASAGPGVPLGVPLPLYRPALPNGIRQALLANLAIWLAFGSRGSVASAR